MHQYIAHVNIFLHSILKIIHGLIYTISDRVDA